MDLVVALYEVTGNLSLEERFALVQQMRRAAVAIPSNIAEGYYRRSTKEYVQFLSIAFASGAELETQIEICKRLTKTRSVNYQSVDQLLEEVMKLLNVSIAKLR